MRRGPALEVRREGQAGSNREPRLELLDGNQVQPRPFVTLEVGPGEVAFDFQLRLSAPTNDAAAKVRIDHEHLQVLALRAQLHPRLPAVSRPRPVGAASSELL